jgi:hypothetical protein
MACSFLTYQSKLALFLASYKCVVLPRYLTRSLSTSTAPPRIYPRRAPTNAHLRKARDYETGGATFRITSRSTLLMQHWNALPAISSHSSKSMPGGLGWCVLKILLQLSLPHYQHPAQPSQAEAQQRPKICHNTSREKSAGPMYIVGNFDSSSF